MGSVPSLLLRAGSASTLKALVYAPQLIILGAAWRAKVVVKGVNRGTTKGFADVAKLME